MDTVPTWQDMLNPTTSDVQSWAALEKEKKVPIAHSSGHGCLMKEAGMIMGLKPVEETKLPHPAEVEFCNELLNGPRTKVPDRGVYDRLEQAFTHIEDTVISTVGVDFVRRSVEDISPNLAYQANRSWKDAINICGPTLRPDITIGVKPTAFSREEIQKLKACALPNAHTYINSELILPILVVEAKSPEVSLAKAERQAVEAASTEVRAMACLYKRVGRETEIEKRIICFSIIHNHTDVKIHGYYFVSIDADRPEFRRILIRAYDIANQGYADFGTSDSFCVRLYEQFTGLHLERIRSAIHDIQLDALPPVPPSTRTRRNGTTLTIRSSYRPSDRTLGPEQLLSDQVRPVLFMGIAVLVLIFMALCVIVYVLLQIARNISSYNIIY